MLKRNSLVIASGLFGVLLVGCAGSGGADVPRPTELWVANGNNSIISFVPAESANGDQPPTASIQGGNTDLTEPTSIAFDSVGRIYVADFSDNSVDVFPAGSSGDVAPTKTLIGAATNINGPEGIGIDSSRQIYVANRDGDSVTVFGATSAGDSAPIRTISGANTLIDGPQQLVVMPDGDFYVVNGANDTVTYFAPGADGDVAPTRTLNVSLGGFPLGLAVDSAGKIYVASTTQIAVYAAGATGAATPLRLISGANTGLQFVEGIAVDSSGNIYASDLTGNCIFVFSPTANGNVAADRTIVGPATTINQPIKPAIR
ncbi:MAG TPA: NHL repeat-containing protein [Fimbriimonadaceae bacterium]|nr:NHL repeat-containing protein [Fimbriimonadaceae bacterium]